MLRRVTDVLPKINKQVSAYAALPGGLNGFEPFHLCQASGFAGGG